MHFASWAHADDEKSIEEEFNFSFMNENGLPLNVILGNGKGGIPNWKPVNGNQGRNQARTSLPQHWSDLVYCIEEIIFRDFRIYKDPLFALEVTYKKQVNKNPALLGKLTHSGIFPTFFWSFLMVSRYDLLK